MRAGGLEAALSPATGGSLLRLSLDGADLLRPTPAEATDPLAMASFPLVPYANRIAHGRYAVAGRSYQLPLNFGDHPHSIHGFGWQAPWAVSETTEAATRLVQDHNADAGWPWSYRAEQHVALSPSELSLSLSLANEGESAMPAGLGFHPYFVADAATRLQFDAQSLLLSTADMLPERAVAADTLGDWSRPNEIAGDSLIDNAYGGWSGVATILRGDDIMLTMRAAGAPWLHLYRPPGEAFFCLEPVSHSPDAINRGGMNMLPPGATATLAMTLSIGKIEPALPKSAPIA